MQLRRVLLAASFCFLAALIPNAGRTQDAGLAIEVTPAKFEIPLEPGQVTNIPLTVHNAGFGATHVQASMVDFGVSPGGEYQFSAVGSHKYSLLKYASIRPREFDMAQGTTQQVQLTISMPADSKMSGEYAGIVFFQTRPERKPGMSVAVSARVASKIYETIPGSVKVDGAITKMAAQRAQHGELYRVAFTNTGNSHEYLRGMLEISKGGSVVDTIKMPDAMLVERGGMRLVEVTGKPLPAGSYQATATIDYGGKAETGGQIAFDVH